MPNIPNEPKLDQITWFETHVGLWAASPELFGASSARVNLVQERLLAARQAFDAARAARQAAMNATVAQNELVGALLEAGRDLVNLMKSHIEGVTPANPSLWALAGLVPDAPPGTAPDPVPPHEIRAELDALGHVIVTWKTKQPAGVSHVIYAVRRAIDRGNGDEVFTLLETTGAKEFRDAGVPAGVAGVSYAIQARRGTQTSGWSHAATLRFGGAGVRVGGAGGADIDRAHQAHAPSLRAA